MNPLVSYIIPCFNQSGFTYEFIASVLFSYSGPIEILVINDSSTEQLTKKVLNEISRRFFLQLI